MANRTIYIEAKHDYLKPKKTKTQDRIKKTLIKKYLQAQQYASPRKVAETIWGYFCRPMKPRIKPHHDKIVAEATSAYMDYKGLKIRTYQWGESGKKVLLSHGWNSKIADFRKMISELRSEGYVVCGVDMPAHGYSEGRTSALPEFRDILKTYYEQNGPFHAVIGYSLGGIAASVMLSELPTAQHPQNLTLISAPPFARYFFEEVVKHQAGCNHKVYEYMCNMVQEVYSESIDYFDLKYRSKQLENINIQLIYDEDDDTVPFARGLEIKECFENPLWIQTKGMGHYKIIADEQVIDCITSYLSPKNEINVAV